MKILAILALMLSSTLTIPYFPHKAQIEVHSNKARFRTVVAGRRFGKSILAENEAILSAVQNPNERTWYCAPTYRQVETVVWRNPSKGIFHFIPKELIKKRYEVDLIIEFINGHVLEFKGCDNEDRLRGVGLRFLVLDELGFMRSGIWNEIFRPMLADTNGRALFIGTPSPNDSPDLRQLYELGQGSDPDYKSWNFSIADNPHITKKEYEDIKASTPVDIFDREYLGKFTSLQGLIYDNFRPDVHLVPGFSPKGNETIVCSIDPGLRNPTAALWSAWDREGQGVVFQEYYRIGLLAKQNAVAIKNLYPKVNYYVIDRSSLGRDPSSGKSIFEDYRSTMNPIVAAPNDAGSVIKGIDDVKKLLHVNTIIGKPRLYITRNLSNTINEIKSYSWYKSRSSVDKNEYERPRKFKDHLMDALRNTVLTKPWLVKSFSVMHPYGREFKGY